MTVQELDDKVWALDGVRMVVRAGATEKVGEYSQKRTTQGNWRITQFLEKRINPLLKGKQVIVVEGNGEEPHGRTLANSIRGSYD